MTMNPAINPVSGAVLASDLVVNAVGKTAPREGAVSPAATTPALGAEPVALVHMSKRPHGGAAHGTDAKPHHAPVTEQTLHTLQRAGAEQARRVLDCMRAFQKSLIHALVQPCLTLSQDGEVLVWNEALAHVTGISAATAEGQPLSTLVSPEANDRIAEATLSLLSMTMGERPMPATFPLNGPFDFTPQFRVSQITLLPLYHIPHVIEAFTLLLAPETA